MRRSLLLLLFPLAACGGAEATVEGTAGDIAWGSSTSVYFGARYVLISATEIDCRDVSWVSSNYDESVKPTDLNVSTLQFTFASGDSVEEGKFPVAQGGQAQATIVNVSGDVFHEYNATAGTLVVDSVEADETATGSFEDLAFQDGMLSGSFTAEHCVNLKP